MSVALMIIAALLIAFIIGISVRGLLKGRVAREQEEADAGVRAGESKAQRDRSLARQADVKAAHAEGSSKVGPDTSE
jgi:hypothetical protein